MGVSMVGFGCLGLGVGAPCLGGGGALPRWRPPLTHTNFFSGLGSQLCAEPVRFGFFGFRVLALSHCINRGSFSSIGIGFLA